MAVLLIVLFIGIPILEIATIAQVQSFLGWPTTITILVLDSIVGAYLVRMQGALAWRRFNEALGHARLPAEEVVDGALILFGGALLLTPGFLTDVVGLSMVFTPTRRLMNRLIRGRVQVQMASGPMGSMFSFGGRRGGPTTPSDEDQRPRTPRPKPPRPGVIDVEVVDVRRNTPPGGPSGTRPRPGSDEPPR